MIGSRQLVDYIPVRGVACSGRIQQRAFAYGAASRDSGNFWWHRYLLFSLTPLGGW
jgi:hypothetical protein